MTPAEVKAFNAGVEAAAAVCERRAADQRPDANENHRAIFMVAAYETAAFIIRALKKPEREEDAMIPSFEDRYNGALEEHRKSAKQAERFSRRKKP